MYSECKAKQIKLEDRKKKPDSANNNTLKPKGRQKNNDHSNTSKNVAAKAKNTVRRKLPLNAANAKKRQQRPATKANLKEGDQNKARIKVKRDNKNFYPAEDDLWLFKPERTNIKDWVKVNVIPDESVQGNKDVLDRWISAAHLQISSVKRNDYQPNYAVVVRVIKDQGEKPKPRKQKASTKNKTTQIHLWTPRSKLKTGQHYTDKTLNYRIANSNETYHVDLKSYIFKRKIDAELYIRDHEMKMVTYEGKQKYVRPENMYSSNAEKMSSDLDMTNIDSKWIPRKYLKSSRYKPGKSVKNYVTLEDANDFIPVVDSKQTIFWTRFEFLKRESNEHSNLEKVKIFDSNAIRYINNVYLKNNQDEVPHETLF